MNTETMGCVNCTKHSEYEGFKPLEEGAGKSGGQGFQEVKQGGNQKDKIQLEFNLDTATKNLKNIPVNIKIFL